MSWLLLALRRIPGDGLPTVGLGLLVLVTALVAAASPRILARLADDALRAEVRSATAATRDVQLIQHNRISAGPDDDPLVGVHELGDELQRSVPSGIRALAVSRIAVVETGRYRVDAPIPDPVFVRLRIQDRIADHVRYVAGRPPTPTVTTRDDVGRERVDDVPVFEVGVSEQAADQLRLALGETVRLAGDPSDPLIGRTRTTLYAFMTITGIYTVPDPDEEYWIDDETLIRPVLRVLSSEIELLDAAVLLDERTYGPLLTADAAVHPPLRYTWQTIIDPDRMRAGRLDRLIADLRRLRTTFPSANVAPGNETAVRTGLPALVEAHHARWTAAESMFAVVALGPAFVAASTLVLIAALASRRRQAAMALARSRGASARQLLGPAAAEGLLIAVPAAALATLGAVVAVPAGRLSATLVAAAVVIAVATGVVLASVVPIVRGHGAEPRAGTRPVPRVGQRRLVLEGLVVLLAVAGAYLLRERGVRATSSAGVVEGFDPLIAAVPALAGVAAGILAVRAYPLPLRALAWLAARRRDLVPVLAVRRAREGAASASVLLVLLATATVGAFAAASLDSLDRGADLTAWQEIGGAYRVRTIAGRLPATLDPKTLPGVEAAAGQFQSLYPLTRSGAQVTFVALDAADATAVLAGSPAELHLPDGFATAVEGPIPAIVSQSIVDDPRGVKPGDEFPVNIQGFTLQYRAVEVREAFPGIEAGRGFVVVDRGQIEARAPDVRLQPTVTILRAPPEAAAAIRDEVSRRAPGATVDSQVEVAAVLRGAPVTTAVRSGILASALVTGAYAALGIAAALALAGIARAVEVARLRTLGLTARQVFALVFAEHGPTTIAAFVAGAALGAGLFLVLRPGLGLGELVGAPAEVPMVVEGGTLALVLAGMIIVVAFGLGLSATLQRRGALATAIRGRFE